MGQDLKHLAFVVDGTLAGVDRAALGDWIKRLAGHCTSLARHSLDEVPGLEGLSFYYPELQEVAHRTDAPPALPALFADAMDVAGAATAARGFELAFLGYPDLLPASWAAVLTPAASLKDHPHRVNFFMGYSGREEIVRAAEAAIGPSPGSHATENDLGRGLLSAGQADPDFIVYATTGFTPRDFMIWQASYAEIWHAPAAGFAFTAPDLDDALKLYGLRVRRFGKV